MVFLTWSDAYSVGVKKLDDQHAALFGILNELYEAMVGGQTPALTADRFHTLRKYTREHFATEEAMMAAAGYPGLEQQRVQHRAMSRQLEEHAARIARHEVHSNVPLLTFLSDWLTNHILKEDKEYRPWMHRAGFH